ncbi:MAG: putative baseplate assembly protein, partial [Anaerolineales bacterium]|nr:putative baseplate assembly protein [Anaerolineales bacterium]
FSEDLSHHILSLTLDFSSAGGAGIDPTLPPYVWEVAQGRQRDQWVRCDIDMDSTRGFNESGRIQIHLPQMNRRRLNEQTLYWVRARVKGISPLEQRQGMRSYQSTPRLKQALAHARGGTVWARHMQTLTNELLGKSDGTPGQRFRTRLQPVLAREAGEVVRVELGGTPAGHWQEITDFAGCAATDNHYTFDSVSGEIRFGPAIRQRDGMIRRFGAIPPRGANIILQRYRVGGGISGNVDTGAINTLKSGIPFVDRVLNREPARGGLDAETIEQAMMRAPSLIRSRDRAMSSDDFEFLTRQALPAKVGRVRALQARPGEDSNVPPGQVYVLIVPQANFPAGYLQADELSLTPEDLATVHEYLDQRRLLTTRLNVRTPAYRWVSVNVQLGTMPGADEGAVEREVLARLYRFLNPLTGGMDGTGWPFGRNLFVADIYQALQNIPNVTFIRNVQLYAARPGGERVGEPVDSIDVVAHGVIVSGLHDVQFVQ